MCHLGRMSRMLNKQWGALLGIALFSSPCLRAETVPFPDVPMNHWARKSLSRAVDTGILVGYEDGSFRGQKLINRFQMAMVIKRIFDEVQLQGPSNVGYDEEAMKELEKAMIEYADELELFNVKLNRLEKDTSVLKSDLAALKSHGMKPSGKNLAGGFSGFLSVGFVDTDRQTCTGCPAGTTGRTRYTAPGHANFFTIPQSSLGLDTKVGKGLSLHVQYDYSTDGGNVVGGGVGLNEAYLVADEIIGSFGGKVGGFALPFQNWEINGPFRSSQFTITPSAKNTYLEAQRVVGMEIERKKPSESGDDLDVRVGVFSGSDGASWLLPFGRQNDAVGLGALTGTATLDDNFGFYVDIEGGQKRNPQAGYRIGFFDASGDSVKGAPSVDGWQVGFWFQGANVHFLFEYLDVDQELGATRNTMDSAYALMNWNLTNRDSVTARIEKFTNVIAGTTRSGSSTTFAFNRKLGNNSLLQLEYLSPDDKGPPSDVDDELIQLRYKVWF